MYTDNFKDMIDYVNAWNRDCFSRTHIESKDVEKLGKALREIKPTVVKENNMKFNTNFKIKDYTVYNNKAVIVEFTDGTEEKAVVHEGDVFDLERAVEICVLKHVFCRDKYKSILP